MTQLIIDHLWQSTLFVAFVAALTLAFRTNGAHIRFGLWFTASLKFLVPFPLIVEAARQVRWRTAPSLPVAAPWSDRLGEFIAPSQAVMGDLIAPSPVTADPSLMPMPAEPGWSVQSFVWTVWACGVGAVVLWRTWQWLRLRAVLRASSPLSIAAPIKVLSSPTLFEPGLFGVFRPILMLPRGIAEHLTPAQLDLVLAHELSHWRRRDNLTAAVHMLVEALFWFHPLVWWIGERLVAERERACDEAILASGANPKTYAESLLAVCRFYVRSPIMCAAGVSGADLKVRVTRIIRNHVARRLGHIKVAALAALALATVFTPLAVGLLTSHAAIAEVAALPSPANDVTDPAAQPPVAEAPAVPDAPAMKPHPPESVPPKQPDAPSQNLLFKPDPRKQAVVIPGPVPCLIGSRGCPSDTTPCLLSSAPCAPKSALNLIQVPAERKIATFVPPMQGGTSNGAAVGQPLPVIRQAEGSNTTKPPAEQAAPPAHDQLAVLPAPETSHGGGGASEAVLELPRNIEKFMSSGNAALSEKKYDRAIAAYSEAVKLAPDNANVFVFRAYAYLAKSDYKRAIADYSEAIRLKPDFAVALKFRGVAYLTNHDNKRAIADFNEAIRLRPDFTSAYYNRGFAHYLLAVYGSYPAYARFPLRDSIDLPLMANTQVQGTPGSRDHLPNAEFNLAIADYDHAIQLKPDLAEAYLNRAYLYAVLYNSPSTYYATRDRLPNAEFDRAIADYDQAIRLKPDLAVAYWSRAGLYASLYHEDGRTWISSDDQKLGYDHAVADYNHAIQLLSESNDQSGLVWFVGENLRSLKRVREAAPLPAPIFTPNLVPPPQPIAAQPAPQSTPAPTAPPPSAPAPPPPAPPPPPPAPPPPPPAASPPPLSTPAVP